MRLILESILADTALWGDLVCLEQIGGDPLKKLTIQELDILQQKIGELRMFARRLLPKIKYEGDQ